MNIFFKFLALGGLGGTVVGAYHLSKQEYKNNHIESTEKKTEEGKSAEDVDVKRQPNTSLTPQEQKPKAEATKTEATKTEAAK